VDIGNQIKVLREERRLTGKDLALKIGLSQSQMSRLEKGQRRIDTEILARIATALDVTPGVFFQADPPLLEDPLTLKRERELSIAQVHVELGKLIRNERRRRHLTSDDLARKTGHTKAYVLAVEEGRRNGLEGEFLQRACRILAIDPFTIVELQERIIRDLKTRVHDLDRRVASLVQGDPEGIAPLPGTPILVGDESAYPTEFGEDNQPMGAVEGFLLIPDLLGRSTFALRMQDDDMTGKGDPSFRRGDIVVFATDRSASSGELAFVRYRGSQTTFRRFYQDGDGQYRLQALEDSIPPVILSGSDIVSAWPLVAHHRAFS